MTELELSIRDASTVLDDLDERIATLTQELADAHLTRRTLALELAAARQLVPAPAV